MGEAHALTQAAHQAKENDRTDSRKGDHTSGHSHTLTRIQAPALHPTHPPHNLHASTRATYHHIVEPVVPMRHVIEAVPIRKPVLQQP